LLNEELEN
jgi:hypothetical protein